MSVLIKGMKMPEGCSDCLFFVDGLYDANDELCSACLAKVDNFPSGCGYKEIDGIDHTTGRMDYCPLVELPEKHGRLIDAEKLKNEYPHDTDWDYPVSTNCYVCESIDNAPTVIEAEGE